MKKLLLGVITATALMASAPSQAETVECTEITTIPAVITVQGVYCFKQNLGTDITSGNAIEIQTNNVTIDFNGFKLGGLAAGAATQANGVHAESRQNIVLRNGSIRGFYRGIFLDLPPGGSSSGHLIEDMIMDGNRLMGIVVEASGFTVRNNRIVNTGQGDISGNAYGIVTENASNGLIIGNLVAGSSETTFSYGIFSFNSSLIEIRGNSVLDIDDSTEDRGIHLHTVSDFIIIDNRILNRGITGTYGLRAINSTGTKCINNTIAGYNIKTSGCNYTAGNHTPP